MPKKMSLAEALSMFPKLDATAIPQEAVQAQTEYEALEDNRLLEAESVIFYLETKGAEHIWRKRVCKLCGSKFLSSYTNVSLCTNECRKNYFESKGMFWNPVGKTEAERWGGNIPRVIGPEATKALQEIKFDEKEESILKEPESPVGQEEDFNVEAFIDSLDI